MSKGKKITVFSIVGVVLALVIVVIVLACVPSYFNNFVSNKCSSIDVYYKGSVDGRTYINQEAISKNNYETYLNLNKEVKEASSEKILTAMFQGSYKFDSKLVRKERNTSAMKTLLGDSAKTHMVFNYTTEQSVTIDGTEVKFYSLIMEVSDKDYLTEVKIYFQKNNVTKADLMESDYETTILAKQAELYNMIENLA